MYQRIVRSRVRATFEQINQGNYRVMVDGLAPSFSYLFHGQHALGGRRTTREAMIRWWQRALRLLPDLQFEVRDVLVGGVPWRTRVAVRAEVSGQLPDGRPYRNTVFQFLTLRWGKVTSVETIEDLQALDQALQAVARDGRNEALAAPINE
jgi:ketosteroid isomerase-like protein